MQHWIGRSILLVAVIHLVFGVVFLGGAFAGVLQGGLFHTVTLTAKSATATAFWFFVAGCLALMLGGLVDHLERMGAPFPTFLPWSLLALTVVGCILMPVSAWWLLLVPVTGMFMRARRGGGSTPASADTDASGGR